VERTAVRSKDLAIVGYDAVLKTLEIAFRSGGVYTYSEVPEEIYQGLMQASSMGIFFRDQIKEKLGYMYEDEVMHRDFMVVN